MFGFVLDGGIGSGATVSGVGSPDIFSPGRLVWVGSGDCIVSWETQAANPSIVYSIRNKDIIFFIIYHSFLALSWDDQDSIDLELRDGDFKGIPTFY